MFFFLGLQIIILHTKAWPGLFQKKPPRTPCQFKYIIVRFIFSRILLMPNTKSDNKSVSTNTTPFLAILRNQCSLPSECSYNVAGAPRFRCRLHPTLIWGAEAPQGVPLLVIAPHMHPPFAPAAAACCENVILHQPAAHAALALRSTPRSPLAPPACLAATPLLKIPRQSCPAPTPKSCMPHVSLPQDLSVLANRMLSNTWMSRCWWM